MISQQEDYKDFDGHLEDTSGEDQEINFSSEQHRAAGDIIKEILVVRGIDNFRLKSFSWVGDTSQRRQRENEKRQRKGYIGQCKAM